MSKKQLLIGAGLVILLIFWSLISFYPDWLWFENLGFSPVFMTMIISRFGFGIFVWIILILLICINLYIAMKLNPGYAGGKQLKERTADYAAQFGISERTLNTLIMAFILILSYVVSSKSSNHWDMILRFFYQEPFGITDPILKKDIGFYIFSLPFYIFIRNGMMSLVVISLLITAGWYLKNGVLQIEGDVSPMDGTPPSLPTIKITPNAKKHLIFLCGILLILMACGFYLKIFGLLYSVHGASFGASYADVYTRILGYRILIFTSLAFGVILIYNAFNTKFKTILISGAVWAASLVLFTYAIPLLAQKFVVKPNELAKESEFIDHNIKFTREAYNLNKISDVDFNVGDSLTPEDLEKNDATIQNIRVWDERPLLQTYKQLETLRPYYDFHNVDVDRYQIEGKNRQIMIAARELVSDQIPSNTWVNRHLKFTHGYGLVSSPVNEVTSEGLPNLFIKGLPPISIDDMKVDQPEIYFGERTDDYVLIKTDEEELDYSKGDKNEYTIYEGEGGVLIGSFIRKLLFAVEFLDPQIFFTTSLKEESRIMYNRRIRNRANIVAPFLQYDSDPYMVVSQGKLFWILDAYTSSDMYPYSSRTLVPGTKKYVNYIRNSVKVVVDAYNGKISFYALDDKDPILRTYKSVFPDLFKPFKDMPEDIKQHIRYPKDLFKIQAKTYTKYHMEDVQVFYNQEDLWQVPDEIYGDRRVEMEPYYIMIKLPEEEKEEFFLMLPVTPFKKDNMIGWLAARCDQADYGNLLVYKLPKKKLVYGPMQIEARIDQQTEISRELSLWDQRGSRVIRGNLLAIPVEDTFIYVEPVYLEAKQEDSEKPAAGQAKPKGLFAKPQSSGTGTGFRQAKPKTAASLPELKRVIVAFGNRVIMHEQLDEALRGILGEDVIPKQPATEKTIEPVTAPGENLTGTAAKALESYRKAKEHLRNGNWAGFGKEWEELEKILLMISKKKEK